MKFIDPLATLKLLGGAVSIHLAMAIYAIYAYFIRFKNIANCTDISDYSDVRLMSISHVLCAILYILKITIRTRL